MKKPTVTILIPAYNEESNIGKLLNDIKKQKRDGFKIDKTVVISDASVDKTAFIARKNGAAVIENKKRHGRAYGQNYIFERVNSDCIVLLDADIRLIDKSLIDKIVKPIINNKSDLTSARVYEIKPSTFIQKILTASMKYKREVFENYKNGNNLYTCHGRVRALSKKTV